MQTFRTPTLAQCAAASAASAFAAAALRLMQYVSARASGDIEAGRLPDASACVVALEEAAWKAENIARSYGRRLVPISVGDTVVVRSFMDDFASTPELRRLSFRRVEWVEATGGPSAVIVLEWDGHEELYWAATGHRVECMESEDEALHSLVSDDVVRVMARHGRRPGQEVV